MAKADDKALEGVLRFLADAGALKDTLRSGWTDGGRRESTAEHSWRLALWVLALEPWLEGLDVQAMLRMAILHDLGEAVTGDVPATEQRGDQRSRQAAEQAALVQLTAPLPPRAGAALREAAAAYDAAETAEAQMMKGLDKLETLLQHASGANPADFDYLFNLGYGVRWTQGHPLLAALRTRVDAMTRARADAASAGRSENPQ